MLHSDGTIQRSYHINIYLVPSFQYYADIGCTKETKEYYIIFYSAFNRKKKKLIILACTYAITLHIIYF